jgi:zinc transport system substrate-binding protein
VMDIAPKRGVVSPQGMGSMRKAWLAMVTALGLAVAGGAARAEAPVVVASIKPVHALVAQVMEGVGTPVLLVGGGASPHTYAMKPSDARTLERAAAVFWIGPDLETFLVKPLKATGVPAIALIDAPGLMLLDAREGGTWEPHQHGGEEHHDHDAREVNPHVWLDPVNAKAMVAAIAAALAKADPSHAATYAANAAAATRRLDALDADLAATLAPVKSRPFVVFHDAYPYLEERYGLEAVGSITVSPDRRPSAKRLSEIRAKLAGLDAPCVFAEPQFEPTLVDTVIEGTSTRKGVLDPEGASLPEGPDLYDRLMRDNAKALVACLK